MKAVSCAIVPPNSITWGLMAIGCPSTSPKRTANRRAPSCENLGFMPVHRFALDRLSPDDRAEGGTAMESNAEMWSITGEQARQNEGSPMANLFLYRAPCFGLNVSEQEMLLFALSGMSDAALADLMSLAVVTVRKRWLSIYEKATDAMPELLPPASGRAGRKASGERRRNGGSSVICECTWRSCVHIICRTISPLRTRCPLRVHSIPPPIVVPVPAPPVSRSGHDPHRAGRYPAPAPRHTRDGAHRR